MQDSLDRLAAAGIVTSLAYGHCGDRGICWTVNCMASVLDSFEQPFAARTLEQAVEIAIIECTKRGWLK